MTPVTPTALPEGSQLVVMGSTQPEYLPLPAAVDVDGLAMTEWEPSAEDLARLLTGGRVRIWVHTFGRPLQPISVEVTG